MKNGSIVGGASNYTIQNNGTATFEDVTATAGNVGSSMLDNFGTLTINSGNYSGGLNVVKSEEGSTLLITGGTFTLGDVPGNGYTAVILVYGDTTITGGRFVQGNDAPKKWAYPQVVATGVVDGYTAITRVSGGTFINRATASGCKIFHGLGKATSDNFEVSGGTFNKSISDGFCAAGFIPKANGDGTYGVKEGAYVAAIGDEKYETLAEAIAAAKASKTVMLIVDTRENVIIDKRLTLDLNGFTLNGGTVQGKAALTVNAARVTIKDSSEAKTGMIKREDTAANSGMTSYYVLDIQGKEGFVLFEGGTVINDSGTTDGARKGASLVRIGDDSVSGAYPQLTIKGGTFTQNNFVAIKVDRGTFYLTGGTINCPNDEAVKNWGAATIKGGTVNGTVASWVYADSKASSTLTISDDATVNGNVYAMSYDGAEGKTAKVSITGGYVTGELGTYQGKNIHEKTALSDAEKASIGVTGGRFTRDPSAYLAEDSTAIKGEDEIFSVQKAYLAKIGDTYYYTMDEAFPPPMQARRLRRLFFCATTRQRRFKTLARRALLLT